MTRGDVHRYLVAYDVSDDRRRNRISTSLRAYGDRVQFSVFVIDASRVRIERVRRCLIELIDPSFDSVLLCDLGPVSGIEDRRFVRLGSERPLTGADSFIV